MTADLLTEGSDVSQVAVELSRGEELGEGVDGSICEGGDEEGGNDWAMEELENIDLQTPLVPLR